MYNTEIVDSLIEKFGIESTIKYCEMKTWEMSILPKNPHNTVEPDYEEWWWGKKYHQLLKEQNDKIS